MNPIKSEAELRETLTRLMRYANTLSPRKLDEPIDPIVNDAIEDTVKYITRQHERELVEARVDENNMYIKELTRHYFPAGPSERHIPLVQFHERIAQLKQSTTNPTNGEEK